MNKLNTLKECKEPSDVGKIVVKDNVVTVKEGKIVYD